ncbi:glycosyltransferase family 4 protein [Mobilicoccus massiliensis]|uniref:glycosyltransferase family 4 protein n=1 Tax=Mobilicoccus massiliensis TaxID=1522310 RepID=UPI00058C029D|nr:glycosyltransferase family 4 protein [Mobilicoccus massiliensis]
MTVAYLTSQYPALSHTFIEREVRAVRDAGVDVATFSVRPCPPDELRSEAMREDAEQTPTLRGSSLSTWARAHASLGRRNPRVFAAGLRRALASGPRTPKGRTWQLFYLAEAVLLYERLRARGITHVHAHFANVASDVARLVAYLGQVEDGPGSPWRWSLTMHGPTEFEAVEAFDLPAKVRSADGIACISDFCRSQLMRFVEPDHWDKMDVVRMSVDAARYRPADDAAMQARQTDDPSAGGGDATGRPLRLLYVGRLVPEKGSPVLLDAIGRLTDEGVPTTTRIVGAGDLRDSLDTAIRARGLGERVELVGPVGQDHLPELYRESDVFVLPSFSEGLPVVLMEAMATGIPVVTTQIAAVGEMVQDGVQGRVVPAGRADLLADAIADLARDPARRREMGRAGRETILAEFVPEVTGPAMARFLQGVRPAR